MEATRGTVVFVVTAGEYAEGLTPIAVCSTKAKARRKARARIRAHANGERFEEMEPIAPSPHEPKGRTEVSRWEYGCDVVLVEQWEVS